MRNEIKLTIEQRKYEALLESLLCQGIQVLELYLLGIRPRWLCGWITKEQNRRFGHSIAKAVYDDEEMGSWSYMRRMLEDVNENAV